MTALEQIKLPSPQTPLDGAPRAVALGLFDGVHLGHRRVIAETIGVEGMRSCVFTFGRQAAALKANACALCSKAHKEHLFATRGVDEWLRANFDAYRDLSPAEFVRDVLVGQLHAKRVCCGKQFRFGKHGAGDTAMLIELCRPYGIEVVAVDELLNDGRPISSDRIRRLIENGQVQEASRLLGHPFLLDLPIVHGQALGRTIGSPTANQVLPPHFVVPRKGVYASTVVIDGKTYYGVSNLGVHPTVGAVIPTCETWIEDFNGDIYGRTLDVVLTAFLRDEQKFDSLDALKAQIARDRETAKALRESNATKAIFFDFDDTLQDRPVAFARYARFFLEKYRPELSEDERAALADEMVAFNKGGYVNYTQFFTEMPRLMGLKNPPPADVLFAEYQRIFPSYVELFPDAREVLETLRARGYRLGCITNGPRIQQHRKLDFSGLRPLFDTVVVSGEEGVHKPDPELFCRAAARLGLAPASCVMVGDHPVNDIGGALSADMQAVLITTRVKSYNDPSVRVIHSLTELLEMFT